MLQSKGPAPHTRTDAQIFKHTHILTSQAGGHPATAGGAACLGASWDDATSQRCWPLAPARVAGSRLAVRRGGEGRGGLRERRDHALRGGRGYICLGWAIIFFDHPLPFED